MFKRLDPRDINITPFNAYKEFTVTNTDSGSGVYGFAADSSSLHNFDPATANVSHFGANPITASFYSIPSYFMLSHRYYRDDGNNFNNFGSSNGKQFRELHSNATIISVPQSLYGERIKPKSIVLKDDSGPSTLTIVDDGDGNLYDNDFSSSFARFAASNFTASVDKTGSFVGNAFYEQGVLVFTNTGSADTSQYNAIGTGSAANGYSLTYKSQVTIKEHSYVCMIGENEYNTTTNISVTPDRSGSINVSGSESWRLFPPGHALAKSGSYKHYYEQATEFKNFTTHSLFTPYITKVGLYNDFNELLAVGQLAKPVKNDKELLIGIQVRFDV
jgi:hypothetical protein|tara:strand:- start:161 stop:1153 length:993 start_codon:yes stop_codon:yes gene_type:complete